MNLTARLILVLFGLAYLISPVDIIPDLLIPFAGWIDDGLVLWCVYYLLRYGDLPWFYFKRRAKQPSRPKTPHKKQQPRSSAGTRRSTSRNTAETGSTGGTGRPAEPTPKKEPRPSPESILGVDENAPWEEIQSAYKEKIKQYHPDKLSHLGEEFTSLANEKFLEIQSAYTTLKARHHKS